MVGTFSSASKPSAGALYQLSEKKNENPCVFSMINISPTESTKDQIAYQRPWGAGSSLHPGRQPPANLPGRVDQRGAPLAAPIDSCAPTPLEGWF